MDGGAGRPRIRPAPAQEDAEARNRRRSHVDRARRIGIGVGASVMLMGLMVSACETPKHAASSPPMARRGHGAPTRQTVDGISIKVPRGWTLRRNPVPALVAPAHPFAVGSWPLPSGGNGCAPSTAISAQPTTGALFWRYEYPSAGLHRSGFPPQEKRFRLGRLGGAFECLGVRAHRILFRSHGRYFQVHVILGRHAGRLRHLVVAALSSLRVRAAD